MIINKVSVYNWMAHKDTTVDISEGKNLLFGRNAIGKSSLAKAIAYNLTGKKSDKYDPRRTTNKEAMVELTLTTKDDQQYLIRRQISQGKRGDESLFIYEADNPSEPIVTGNNAEQFLNDMIGISFDVFERIIYMKEEDVHSFLADPDNAVLKEIDRLIGLEKATTIINSLNRLNDFLRGEKRAIVRQRRDREKGIRVKLGAKASTREVKKIEKELDEIEGYTGELLELKALIDKRDGFALQLEEKKEKLEVEEIDKLEAKILEQQAAKKEELSKFKEKEEQKRQNYVQLREHHSKIKAKEDLNQTIISDLKEQLEEGTISECPTCRREMDQELAEEVIGNLEQQIKKLKGEIQEKLQKINGLKKELDQNSKLIRETEQKIQRLNEMKSEVEVLLEGFHANKNAIEQFDDDKKYPKTISAIENKLDELDDQSKELTRELGKAEGAEEVTEEKIEELKEEENSIKHKQKICELIAEASKKTGDKLRREFTAEVKNQAEKIWKKYKEDKWEIDWDENFVPKAKPLQSDRWLTAYEMSGSEKFLILLAIRLAILKTLEHFKLLIIDEPCQHLDEINGKAFRDILTSLEGEEINQSIIFTFNKDFLEGDWTNIVKLSEIT